MSVSLWHSKHPFQRLEDENDNENQLLGGGEPSRPKGVSAAPRLDLNLDQASCHAADKHITGSLYIDTTGVPSAVKVLHLRVQVVGTARIHGDDPTQPLSYGLFDYKNDIKLLSKGIRIVNKRAGYSNANASGSNLSNEDIIIMQPCQSSSDTHGGIHHQHQKMDPFSSTISSMDQSSDAGGAATNESKSQQSRAIDNFIIDLALDKYPLKHSSGSLLEQQQAELLVEDKVYSLPIDTLQRVRFALPIQRKRPLPGTFDNPHYPISYTVAAVMIYCTQDNNSDKRYLSHTMTPVIFEPSPITPPFDGQKGDILRCSSNDCHYISQRKIERILLGMLHKHQYRYRQGRRWILVRFLSALKRSSTIFSTPYVACSLELENDQMVFQRGQPIPLRVHLESHGFALEEIVIRVKIRRTILLTCNVGEQGESDVVSNIDLAFPLNAGGNNIISGGDASSADSSGQDSAYLESNPDDDACNNRSKQPSSFGHNATDTKAVFDLSNVLFIGEDWAYTVIPEMTRRIFELQYDLETKIYIRGSKLDDSTTPREKAHTTKYYVATEDSHRIPSMNDKSLYQHTLRPTSLPLIVTGCHNRTH
ncbi:hypothetical protein O0I10_008597 [Lichtheimia ornata]|uniref:Uncharacterized protein n=1 Tax=Lichtheimia ornata TaxID=688661 RepID=A0AAD7UZZ2_9FUNG|nr:uncharacterized protein O0I10_008597 [Lichtheimia ornata]KAJ8655712.1 hypothetical protein O0I10_008597 [Lichtheimia ornata]